MLDAIYEERGMYLFCNVVVLCVCGSGMKTLPRLERKTRRLPFSRLFFPNARMYCRTMRVVGIISNKMIVSTRHSQRVITLAREFHEIRVKKSSTGFSCRF